MIKVFMAETLTLGKVMWPG